MAKKSYSYKGKEVFLQAEFDGQKYVLVSYSKDGKRMFKIPSE